MCPCLPKNVAVNQRVPPHVTTRRSSLLCTRDPGVDQQGRQIGTRASGGSLRLRPANTCCTMELLPGSRRHPAPWLLATAPTGVTLSSLQLASCPALLARRLPALRVNCKGGAHDDTCGLMLVLEPGWYRVGVRLQGWGELHSCPATSALLHCFGRGARVLLDTCVTAAWWWHLRPGSATPPTRQRLISIAASVVSCAHATSALR